jgi:hypothetical protein
MDPFSTVRFKPWTSIRKKYTYSDRNNTYLHNHLLKGLQYVQLVFQQCSKHNKNWKERSAALGIGLRQPPTHREEVGMR